MELFIVVGGTIYANTASFALGVTVKIFYTTMDVLGGGKGSVTVKPSPHTQY